MGRFEGKSVLITGGSSGIGEAVGVSFARDGARVALLARSSDRLEAAANRVRDVGGEALTCVCDVSDRGSIDAAVDHTIAEFGVLDVVIANAGFGVGGFFEDLKTDDYRRQFETNVYGVIDTLYATLPHVIETRGRIGIVSSVLGKISRPGMSAYAASKFAVCGFAEAIYYELLPKGVSVTCINPGLIESNFRRVDNQGTYHPERPEVAPEWLMVPTARAARAIVSAVYRRDKEATITGHGKIAVWTHRHFPWLFHIAMRHAARDSKMLWSK